MSSPYAEGNQASYPPLISDMMLQFYENTCFNIFCVVGDRNAILQQSRSFFCTLKTLKKIVRPSIMITRPVTSCRGVPFQWKWPAVLLVVMKEMGKEMAWTREAFYRYLVGSLLFSTQSFWAGVC